VRPGGTRGHRQATEQAWRRLLDVEANSPELHVPWPAAREPGTDANAEAAVTALYRVHAVGLIRLAVVMLGDRAAAEDVVQDSFCALYRRFGSLDQPDRALAYVRSSVLNGCRSELRARRRGARRRASAFSRDVASAEDDVLLGEEHRLVLRSLRRLPDRQREALVLRFFLDLPEPQIARSMGISQGTVKSTTSRALAALARLLGEDR
jgi:RNA polymerase sigma-70 factor (sigma-E family)